MGSLSAVGEPGATLALAPWAAAIEGARQTASVTRERVSVFTGKSLTATGPKVPPDLTDVRIHGRRPHAQVGPVGRLRVAGPRRVYCDAAVQAGHPSSLGRQGRRGVRAAAGAARSIAALHDGGTVLRPQGQADLSLLPGLRQGS